MNGRGYLERVDAIAYCLIIYLACNLIYFFVPLTFTISTLSPYYTAPLVWCVTKQLSRARCKSAVSVGVGL